MTKNVTVTRTGNMIKLVDHTDSDMNMSISGTEEEKNGIIAELIGYGYTVNGVK